MRRLRLRVMWGAALLYTTACHGRLIRAVGMSRRRFVMVAYRRFGSLLERIVPYRRDALLAALLD